MSHVLWPALNDDSEAGVSISSNELSAILAVAPPNGTTAEMVATNGSITPYQDGIVSN